MHVGRRLLSLPRFELIGAAEHVHYAGVLQEVEDLRASPLIAQTKKPTIEQFISPASPLDFDARLRALVRQRHAATPAIPNPATPTPSPPRAHDYPKVTVLTDASTTTTEMLHLIAVAGLSTRVTLATVDQALAKSPTVLRILKAAIAGEDVLGDNVIPMIVTLPHESAACSPRRRKPNWMTLPGGRSSRIIRSIRRAEPTTTASWTPTPASCGGRPPATATTPRRSSAAATGACGCSARWPGR